MDKPRMMVRQLNIHNFFKLCPRIGNAFHRIRSRVGFIIYAKSIGLLLSLRRTNVVMFTQSGTEILVPLSIASIHVSNTYLQLQNNICNNNDNTHMIRRPIHFHRITLIKNCESEVGKILVLTFGLPLLQDANDILKIALSFYHPHPNLHFFVNVLKDVQTETYIKIRSSHITQRRQTKTSLSPKYATKINY
ncbi:hypothetical protein AGLY_003730 [Aphis glycines]|uniref:Uncharacterized protein n=1 Tax=Aphis glycines TaxID=307491 RepID=A0A6G0TZ14_APHGL|nr:hypothetical protein AGLY_003730 [Aphis glycines]